MSYTLGDVMDRAASLLNDTAKSDYTYTAQLPYVGMALDELQEEFEQNNVPTTNSESSVIVLPIGTTDIGFTTTPALPSDLIEIQQIWERLSGSAEPYIPMTRVEFLPHYLDGEIIDVLVFWAWEQQKIKTLGATTARDLKLDYIASLFPTSYDQTTSISIINTKSFLAYRTAALCAEFIGENPTRAQSLNQDAVLAMDRALAIPTKGRQSIAVRRRPFRASYRSRQVW